MSIDQLAVNDRRVAYVASAGQTAFPFDFPIYATGDLRVLRVTGELVETLTHNNGCTVSGLEGTGGNVILPVPATAGQLVIIEGALPLSRATRFTARGPLPAASVEEELMRWVMVAQELARKLGFAIAAPPWEAVPDMTLPGLEARASRLLGFDPFGKPTVYAPNEELVVVPALLADALILHGTTNVWIDLATNDSILRGGRYNVVANRGGMSFDLETGLVTVQKAGWYRVWGTLRVDATTGAGPGAWYVVQNGVKVKGFETGGQGGSQPFAWLGECAAGDTLGLLSHEGDPPRINLYGTSTQVYVDMLTYPATEPASPAPIAPGGGFSGELAVGRYQLSDDMTGPVLPTEISDSLPQVATLTQLVPFLATVSTTTTSVRLHHMRAGASLANVLASIPAGERQTVATFPAPAEISAGDYLKLEVVAAGDGMGLKATLVGTLV